MNRRHRRERQRRRRSATRPRAGHARLAAGAGISLAAVLGAPAAAQATDFAVTTLGDPPAGPCAPGDCSLREAVGAAEADATADRILFQAGLTGTIALGGGQGDLDVTEPLEVLGPGAAALSVSADLNSRIFNIDTAPGDLVTISGLALSGGDLNGAGGAIRSSDAKLTIRDSTISGNDAGSGGGVSTHQGTTTIEGSTISGNEVAYGGGGVLSVDGSTTTIEGSTISGNYAVRGGGVYSRYGTTTIEGSTISGNDAADEGGGVYSGDGTATIEGSTISGNEAADEGGGVLTDSSDPEFPPSLANTIVAANLAPTGPDLRGLGGDELIAAFSLFGSTAGATVNETVPGSNITGLLSPQLGPLADNGGPTDTMALPPTSPAVNRGSSFGATTDQRGLPRPVAYPGVPFSTAAGADGADIGAFELQLPPPPASNNLTFGKLKLNRRRGIAILPVRVPGPGRVILLRTRKVRRAVRNPAAAGVVRLPVRARAKALRRLLRTGRVRVRARVTFRPTGGTPRTKSRTVRLVKRKRR